MTVFRPLITELVELLPPVPLEKKTHLYKLLVSLSLQSLEQRVQPCHNYVSDMQVFFMWPQWSFVSSGKTIHLHLVYLHPEKS